MGRFKILACAVLTLAASLAAAPAPADQPSGCVAPSHAATNFPDLAGFQCVNLGSDEANGITIRVLRDNKLSEKLGGKFAPALMSAAANSIKVYLSLHQQSVIHDITFLLTDHKGDGSTGMETKVGTEDKPQCMVQVYATLFADGKYDDLDGDAKFTTAHEMAHCIQQWNFRNKLSKTAEWWSEGSADYLATLVYPEGKQFGLWTDGFAAAVGKRSLISLKYENYVLFAWLAKERGVSSIFAFWDAMPDSTDGQMNSLPKYQQDAALKFLTSDGLQKFARDYVDGNIAGGRGERVEKANLGTPIEIRDDINTRNTAGPFTLLRGQLIFSGGAYDLAIEASKEPEPEYKLHDNWQKEMDFKVEAPCGKSVTYTYAGFNTSNSGQWLTIKAQKDSASPSCAKCVDLGQRAQCVAGVWSLDNTALRELLGGQLKNAKVQVLSGTGTYQFDASGSGKITISNASILAQSNDSRTLVKVGASGYVVGKWSSSGSQLNFCPVSGSLPISVKATIFAPTAVTTTTTHSYSLDPIDFTFECGGSSLKLISRAGKFASGASPEWKLWKGK